MTLALQSTRSLAQAAAPASPVAEGASLSSEPSPSKSYDFNIHGGPFLPSGIPYVRQLMNAWGLRASAGTRKGVFEAGFFTAHNDGISYTSTFLDYRIDVANEYGPVHFLLGGHGDYYTPLGKSSKIAGGWHYGGGFTIHVSGPVYIRADFEERFSPGTTVYVDVGITIRIPE